MTKMNRMLIFGLLFFCHQVGFSTQDSLYTAYQHGLNNDLWQGGMVFQKQLSSRTYLIFSENVSSSRLEVTPETNQWKDQNQLLFGLDYQLTPNYSLSFAGNSYLFKDNQSGYISDFTKNQIEYANQIQTHYINLGAKYNRKIFYMPLLIGIKEDHRFKQTDRGLSYQLGMNMNRLNINDYYSTFSGILESDDLGKRSNRTLTMDYLIHRQFYTDTYDTLRLNLQRFRREYYISQIGDIERREEKIQGAENILSYRLSHHFLCRFTTSLSSRTLQINIIAGEEQGLKRERKDFTAQGAFHLLFKNNHIHSQLSFTNLNTEQTYQLAKTMISSYYSGSSQLITPDNRSGYSSLMLRTGWRFLPGDSLTIISIVQRYRYDTPSEENVDDRDELRYRVNLKERHTFSPSLSLSLDMNVHLLHLVYINGEKSANNNWTRIFRINPTVIWKPSRLFTFSHSTEVMANYVDYDFENMFPGIRSFLYRKLKMEDSTRVQLTPKTSVFFFYRLELDENGKMLWGRWLEQILVERQSHTLTCHLNYTLTPSFQLSPGYTFFHRRGYRYQETQSQSDKKESNQNYKSHGPTITITYQSPRLIVDISGSTINTNSIVLKNQLLTRINLNVVWRI